MHMPRVHALILAIPDRQREPRPLHCALNRDHGRSVTGHTSTAVKLAIPGNQSCGFVFTALRDDARPKRAVLL